MLIAAMNRYGFIKVPPRSKVYVVVKGAGAIIGRQEFSNSDPEKTTFEIVGFTVAKGTEDITAITLESYLGGNTGPLYGSLKVFVKHKVTRD